MKQWLVAGRWRSQPLTATSGEDLLDSEVTFFQGDETVFHMAARFC